MHCNRNSTSSLFPILKSRFYQPDSSRFLHSGGKTGRNPGLKRGAGANSPQRFIEHFQVSRIDPESPPFSMTNNLATHLVQTTP